MDCAHNVFSTKTISERLSIDMPYIRIDIYTEHSVFRECDKEICMFVYMKDSPLTLKGKLELNFM